MSLHVLWRNGWVAIPSGRARQSSSAREPLLTATYGLAPKRFLSKSRVCLKDEKSTKSIAPAVPVAKNPKNESHEDPALSAACQRMAGAPKALPKILTSIIEDPPAPAWREVGEKLRSSILLVDRKIAVDISVASKLAYMIPLKQGATTQASQVVYTTLLLHLAELIEKAVKAGEKDVAFSQAKYEEWLKAQGGTRTGNSIAVANKASSTTERQSAAGNPKAPAEPLTIGVDPEPATITKGSDFAANTASKDTVKSVDPTSKPKGKETQDEKVAAAKPNLKSPSTSSTSQKKSSSSVPKVAITATSKGSVPVTPVTPVAKVEAPTSEKIANKKTATKGRAQTKAKTETIVSETKDNKRQTAFKSSVNALPDPPIHISRQKTLAKLRTDRLLTSDDHEIADLASKVLMLMGHVPRGPRFVVLGKRFKKLGQLHDKSLTKGSSKAKTRVKAELRSFLGSIPLALPAERKDWAKSVIATPLSASELSETDLANRAQPTTNVTVPASSSAIGPEASALNPNSVEVEDMAVVPNTQLLVRKRAKRIAERIRVSSRPVRTSRSALRGSRPATAKGDTKSRKVDADANASQAEVNSQEQDALLSPEAPVTATSAINEPPSEIMAAMAALPAGVTSEEIASIARSREPAQRSTPRGYEAVAKRERRIRLALEAKRAAAAQLNALNALGRQSTESALNEGVPQPVLASMMDANMAAMAEEQSVQVLRQIRYTPAIKRNAVMISTNDARAQAGVKVLAAVEKTLQNQAEVTQVPAGTLAPRPLDNTTPPTLSERPEPVDRPDNKQVGSPSSSETPPGSAPGLSNFFDAVKGGLQSAWDWLSGAGSASDASAKFDTTPQEPPEALKSATVNSETTIMDQIDDLFVVLQRNKKDFGEALEEELARHAEEQSVELLAYRENFHRTSGVSYLPADLKQQLDYQDVAIGQVNFLEDRRRVMWEFSHWTSVEGTLWVDKDKSRKEAYRAFHHAISHPDPTLMIYSDGSFRDSQMGRTTSQRFSGGGVHIKTPLPISYSISLGTTMRGSNEAELATYLWAIRMVRTLLTSPIGEAIRAEQNYKRVLFATDSTNTLRLLSRIRQGGVPDSRTIMLLSLIQVEAIALSRLFDGLDILGLWVPREFNKEIQLADQLAVKGSAQARRTSFSQVKTKKGKKK